MPIELAALTRAQQLGEKPDTPLLFAPSVGAAEAAQRLVGERYVAVVYDDALPSPDATAAVMGRRALIWPRVGESAQRLANILLVVCPEVKIVVAPGKPEGWGPAHAIADGWGWAELVNWAGSPGNVVLATSAPAEAPPEAPAPDAGGAVDDAPPIGEPEPLQAPRKRRQRPPRASSVQPGDDPTPPPASVPSLFPWEGRPWASKMICTDKGQPKPILANAITAIAMDPEWEGVLAHDEFAMQTEARREPPFQHPTGPWTDVADILAAEWLQRVGIIATPTIAAQAVEAVAKRSSFHPVRDYLKRCRAAWDGRPRVDTWLSYYLGAADADYVHEIGRVFLLGAAKRILRDGLKPTEGVKFDTALILEGPQGRRKSMVFKVLGGEWFTDDVSDLGSKDSKMEIGASWIIELSELSAMTNGEIETVKAFISREVDHFRPPYGRRLVKRPRQCALGGTSNNSEYLKDDRNRRFLPCRVGERIDIEGLREAVDQLWGEAVARAQGGENHWIESVELLEAARKQQEIRRQFDEWENYFMVWLAGEEQQAAPISSITVGDFLSKVVSMPKDRQDQRQQNRAARILKLCGWEKRRRRLSNRMFVWEYVKPAEPENPACSEYETQHSGAE